MAEKGSADNLTSAVEHARGLFGDDAQLGQIFCDYDVTLADLLAAITPESRPRTCPSCDSHDVKKTTTVSPVHLGPPFPDMEVEHHILDCSACGQGFYEDGEYDAATLLAFRTMQAEEIACYKGTLMEGLELAWGLLANVSGGNWHDQTEEWRTAAQRWRDKVWHSRLDAGAEPTPEEPVTLDDLADVTLTESPDHLSMAKARTLEEADAEGPEG